MEFLNFESGDMDLWNTELTGVVELTLSTLKTHYKSVLFGA